MRRPIYSYYLKSISAKFHRDPIWNDEALKFVHNLKIAAMTSSRRKVLCCHLESENEASAARAHAAAAVISWLTVHSHLLRWAQTNTVQDNTKETV